MFKRRDVIVTLWMTFLTVVAWIGFGIYHIWITSTINEIDVSAISPIDPNFDMSIINALKNREMVSPLYHFADKADSETASIAAKSLPSSQHKEIIPQPSRSP